MYLALSLSIKNITAVVHAFGNLMQVNVELIRDRFEKINCTYCLRKHVILILSDRVFRDYGSWRALRAKVVFTVSGVYKKSCASLASISYVERCHVCCKRCTWRSWSFCIETLRASYRHMHFSLSPRPHSPRKLYNSIFDSTKAAERTNRIFFMPTRL